MSEEQENFCNRMLDLAEAVDAEGYDPSYILETVKNYRKEIANV